MNCPKCGNQLSDGAKFCNNCGASIAAASAAGKKKKPLWKQILVTALAIIVGTAAGKFAAGLMLTDKPEKPQTSNVQIQSTTPKFEMPTVPTVPKVEIPEATLPARQKTVYVKVPLGWGDVRIWAWSESRGDAFDSWPGEQMTLSGEWYYGQIPEWCTHVVFSAWGGSDQSEDIALSGDSVEYIDLTSDSSGSSDIEIIPSVWSEDYYSLGNGGYSAVLETVEPVRNCNSVNFTMISQGNYNSTVSGDWELKFRINGKWESVDKFYYSGGEQNVLVLFNYPVTFDAVTAYPVQLGNYSYQCDFLLWGADCG